MQGNILIRRLSVGTCTSLIGRSAVAGSKQVEITTGTVVDSPLPEYVNLLKRDLLALRQVQLVFNARLSHNDHMIVRIDKMKQ